MCDNLAAIGRQPKGDKLAGSAVKKLACDWARTKCDKPRKKCGRDVLCATRQQQKCDNGAS
jgi:hypothetical protein